MKLKNENKLGSPTKPNEAVVDIKDKVFEETKTINEELVCGIDDVPPWYLCILLGLQDHKSKRQPPNLKKLLTRARFEEQEEKPKVTKCNRPNCGLCIHLITGNQFIFKSGKQFSIKSKVSCDVKNVIYVIRCSGCGEEYIGETGDQLRKRVTVHKQQIRNESLRILKMSEHVANCARTAQPNFRIFPMYKMNNDNSIIRKIKENYFIKVFNPKLNCK